MCEVKKSTGNWDTRPVQDCSRCEAEVLDRVQGDPANQWPLLKKSDRREAARRACLEAHRWWTQLEKPNKTQEQMWDRAANNFTDHLQPAVDRRLKKRANWEELGHFFRGICLMVSDFTDWTLKQFSGKKDLYVAPPDILQKTEKTIIV